MHGKWAPAMSIVQTCRNLQICTASWRLQNATLKHANQKQVLPFLAHTNTCLHMNSLNLKVFVASTRCFAISGKTICWRKMMFGHSVFTQWWLLRIVRSSRARALPLSLTSSLFSSVWLFALCLTRTTCPCRRQTLMNWIDRCWCGLISTAPCDSSGQVGLVTMCIQDKLDVCSFFLCLSSSCSWLQHLLQCIEFTEQCGVGSVVKKLWEGNSWFIYLRVYQFGEPCSFRLEPVWNQIA